MTAERSLDILLRAARTEARLSQAELAARAGVTRQAISAVETGKAVPTTAVALCIARVLGRRVEDLFQLADDRPQVAAELVGAPLGIDGGTMVRVQVATLQGRVVARPLSAFLDGEQSHFPANGVARGMTAPNGGTRRNGKIDEAKSSTLVDLFAAPDELARGIVLVGSHPLVPSLAEHLRRRYPGIDLVWQPGDAQTALRAVARAEAHVAGLEQLDSGDAREDLSLVRDRLGPDVKLLQVATSAHGLLVCPGNPKGIRDVSDLMHPGIGIVNQEPGSVSRTLLDRELRRLQIDATQIAGYLSIVRSPGSAADVVAAHLADCALGSRGAAVARGLDFIPLARVRFDLAIPASLAEHRSVQALLETLVSPMFRLEVEALGDYDSTTLGNRVSGR